MHYPRQLDPLLNCHRRADTEPLRLGDELMGTFHLTYADIDPDVLLLIDDHFAHGNLRDWASFTHTAAKLCTEHGRDRVDVEIARNAFALHGGGINA